MRIRKSAEERKSELVETALRLSDKFGPDRLTTERIAQVVGVTQAAIFRHFPTKQDLWRAVAARIGEKFQQRWTAVDAHAAEPLEKLRALVLGQLSLIQSAPAIQAILFSRELHAENKSLRIVFWEMMQQFQTRIERLIEAAQRQGALREDIAAADMAFLVIGLAQGLVLRWSLSGRSFDIPQEGARLLALQLRAFRPSAPKQSEQTAEQKQVRS